MDSFHKPVLLQSACAFLDIHPGLKYVDATLGGGGHTAEILRRGGQVLGLDQDSQAVSACLTSQSLQPALASGTFKVIPANFIHLREVVLQNHWQPLSGILFDLGLSSHQLDTPSRGFSFQTSGPLDMRMDLSLPHTAATLVNTLSQRDLAKILLDYGEVNSSLSVAGKIISRRPYSTTGQLFAILGRADLARRVFQALRIAVNDELGSLQTVLPQALSLLSSPSRLVVITFHSLEDRIIKSGFSAWEKSGWGKHLTPDPVLPEPAEIAANPRCKSAKLRAFSKII